MDRKYDSGRSIIAAFDFDGTLTVSDSLMAFLLSDNSFFALIKGLLSSSLYLLLYALRLMPNYIAKQRLFASFYKGMPIAEFDARCVRFRTRLESIKRKVAVEKMLWHQEQGHRVVIISASLENWIRPWAEQHGVKEILATRAEVESGKLTGSFLTKNCYGEEKVRRLVELCPDRHAYILYAYGDSKGGDGALLSFADHAFYRTFD